MSIEHVIGLGGLAITLLGFLVPWIMQRSVRVKVLVHRASFLGASVDESECYFVTVTNVSAYREVEITHIWFDTTEKVHVLRDDRPLPKRLKVEESWCTWVPVSAIPSVLLEDEICLSARVRLSNGKVFKSKRNTSVPDAGAIPGAGYQMESTEVSNGGRESLVEASIEEPSHVGLSESQTSPIRAFISHSIQDRPFVERFAADLRANGVDVWYSGWEIKPGDSLRAKIEEGLENCEYFIIVMSQSSVDRPWVRTELDAATVRKISGKVRKIIPIKIEACAEVPSTLAALCWEDFSNQSYESALRRVLGSIFEIDVKPPMGNRPSDLLPYERANKGPNGVQNSRPSLVPVSMYDLKKPVEVLQSEGFDVRSDMFNGQVGLVIGPRGLDPEKMPSGIIGLFFPLWELNHPSNRELTETRKFYEIYERRPSDWSPARPYPEDFRPSRPLPRPGKPLD